MCALKVKKFHGKSSHRFLQLCDEAAVSVDLSYPHRHPNVVAVDFVILKEDELYFLAELVDGEDLDKALTTAELHRGTHEEANRRLLMLTYELALSLEYLHKRGILHQDVKPANVLYAKNGGAESIIGSIKSGLKDGTVKLTDFGVSSRATKHTMDDDGGYLLEACLRGYTPSFASGHTSAVFSQMQSALTAKAKAAILRQHPLTHYDDIWSFAVTVVDMWAGGASWRMGLPSHVAWKRLDEIPTHFANGCTMPDELAGVLEDCLDQVCTVYAWCIYSVSCLRTVWIRCTSLRWDRW
jgi:serine/threonine protein kinase